MIEGRVEEELLFESGSSSYSGNLDYVGIERESVEIRVGDNYIEDDEFGNLKGEIIESGSIDYSDGSINIEFSSNIENDVYVSYYSYERYIYSFIKYLYF